jgi:hypothetical protein
MGHPGLVVEPNLDKGDSEKDWSFSGAESFLKSFGMMAGTTGLEPATSAVTGQRSNQLSYVPAMLPSGLR